MKLKSSQKVRVIVDNVHFYTTVGQIRKGVGTHTTQNAAVLHALQCLIEEPCQGFCCGWQGYNVQIDLQD